MKASTLARGLGLGVSLLLMSAATVADDPGISVEGAPTTVHDAVRNGHIAILRAVIAKARSLDARDEEGWTALMHAIANRNEAATTLLLEAGASPNIGDKLGRTPLHLAATEGSLKICQLLVQAGANVNSRDAGGVTPIMRAAGNGRRDITELLLRAGARLDMKDYQGNSVVDWSRKHKDRSHTRMLEQKLLLEAGNKPLPAGEDFAEDVFADVRFPDWFKPSFLDLQEDLEEALDSGKQGLLIFISTRRCSYCKAFIENSLNRPKIRSRLQTGFDVVGLELFDDSEMTGPEGRSYRVKEFAAANKAAYTPTLIFYGARGRQLLKIVGYYPPDKFRRVLDYLDNNSYLHESLRSYLARTDIPVAAPVTKVSPDFRLFSRPPYMLDRRAVRAQRPLLVLFERAGCPGCQRFHEKVLGEPSVRRLLKAYQAVHLDASDHVTRVVTPDGKRVSPAQWYEQLGLAYSPAMVFFDDTGKEVLRLDSETRRYRMEGSLQLVLEKGDQQDAQLQRWRRDKALELFRQRSE